MTKQEQAKDKAYKEAGHNAYFGNGFDSGVKFAIASQKVRWKDLMEKYEKRLKIIEKTRTKCHIFFGVEERLTKKQNLIHQFISDLKELDKCQN